jgi:Rod binding domain-containing protein
MMDAEMAINISNRGGIGLSEMLLQQLAGRSSQISERESDESE